MTAICRRQQPPPAAEIAVKLAEITSSDGCSNSSIYLAFQADWFQVELVSRQFEHELDGAQPKLCVFKSNELSFGRRKAIDAIDSFAVVNLLTTAEKSDYPSNLCARCPEAN